MAFGSLLIEVSVAALVSAFAIAVADFKIARKLTALPGAKGRTEETQLSGYKEQIAVRYAAGEGDRLLAYIDRVLDRQINKARGILPFNAFIMAFLTLLYAQIKELTNPWLYSVFYAGITAFILSSLFCLGTFEPEAPARKKDAHDFVDEFDQTFDIIASRTKKLERGLWLSYSGLGATALLLVVLLVAHAQA